MSTADHVTCCCAETLADIERLTQERDDARDTACRLEAELACPGYLTDLDAMPDPTTIIEWLASVGLDAQRIPAREPRLVRRDGGAWFLRFYEFALDADGRRILDGDGFAHTPTREVEVATLPPEPWLSDWVAPLDDLDDDAERLEQWRRSVEGQEGAESGPSRVADGLEGLDWHSRTPATGEARKSAESDADDDAEWDAREAIERARGGR